jgi:hypothetical protein
MGNLDRQSALRNRLREDAYAPLAGSWPADNRAERAAMWLESLRKEDERPLVLVAELDAAMVGFVVGGCARRPDRAELEVHVIHVHPAYRGRRMGATSR